MSPLWVALFACAGVLLLHLAPTVQCDSSEESSEKRRSSEESSEKSRSSEESSKKSRSSEESSERRKYYCPHSDEPGNCYRSSTRSCERKLVGYVTNWSTVPFNCSSAKYLTHVIYAFVTMTADGHIAFDNTAVAQRRLEEVKRARTECNVKVMFAVAGYSNSQYFSAVAADPRLTATFVKDVVNLVDTHCFDGLNLDWEYPSLGGKTKGCPEDKANYVALVEKLREALGWKKIITMAVPASEANLVGFDIPALEKSLDFFNIMLYDFCGTWSANTCPLAPLYDGSPANYSKELNLDWVLNKYACTVKDRCKLVAGLPFYGTRWLKTVSTPFKKYDMYRIAVTVDGSYGSTTSYATIKESYINNPSFVQKIDKGSRSPYLVGPKPDRMIVSYDNEKSLREKVKYVCKHQLGGAVIWSVDQDDADQSLIKTVYNQLCRGCKSKGRNKGRYTCD